MRRAFSRRNLWDSTPRVLKSASARFLGIVPQAYLLGRRFRRNLSFAREAQRWPVERAREFQLDQLRRTCALAYGETRYYRQTFKSVGFEPGDLKSLDDLARLPTIDKHTVRAQLDEMCAVDLDSGGIDYVSTGGSSGQPLRFYASAGRSAIEYAYLVAGWERAGYDLRLPQAVFRGQIVAENRQGLRHEYDAVLRRHYYSNFHMTDENMRRYLAHISTIGPCFLLVYPSSVTVLARHLDRTKVAPPSNIRGVLAGSENVLRGDRAMVERVFGVRYFSWYGHSEKLVLAAECEHSTDYHVWPTYGYCELLDEHGHRVTTPGQRGEIVGTGFINRVVPFIRYRTGDYATYVGDRCDACGREHMILKDVQGRWPQGNLIAASGAAISLTALNVHDDTFEGVRDYQFHQVTPGEATLRVVPARPLSREEQARIVSRMSGRMQGQIALELELCKELEKTGRGKLPRVVGQAQLSQPREKIIDADR